MRNGTKYKYNVHGGTIGVNLVKYQLKLKRIMSNMITTSRYLYYFV